MAAAGDLEALAELDGVLDVTLCDDGGRVVRSSASSEELEATALHLASALGGLATAQGETAGGMTLTIEYAGGMLHGFRVGKTLLLVHAASGANHGAIRQEMRQFSERGAS